MTLASPPETPASTAHAAACDHDTVRSAGSSAGPASETRCHTAVAACRAAQAAPIAEIAARTPQTAFFRGGMSAGLARGRFAVGVTAMALVRACGRDPGPARGPAEFTFDGDLAGAWAV